MLLIRENNSTEEQLRTCMSERILHMAKLTQKKLELNKCEEEKRSCETKLSLDLKCKKCKENKRRQGGPPGI